MAEALSLWLACSLHGLVNVNEFVVEPGSRFFVFEFIGFTLPGRRTA